MAPAPSISHFRFYTVCLGKLDYVSSSLTEESDQENSVRELGTETHLKHMEAIQGQAS